MEMKITYYSRKSGCMKTATIEKPLLNELRTDYANQNKFTSFEKFVKVILEFNC